MFTPPKTQGAGLVAWRWMIPPLPGGEGRGEGKRVIERTAVAFPKPRWTCLLLACFVCVRFAFSAVVFETTSPYHHIRVVDQQGIRTLSFDQSQETRMSLRNPLTGHFSYTEFFHMPWLWNPKMKSVLMIGLGGGSIQRAYQRSYPDVVVDTVELDPTVVEVAKKYFFVTETPTHKIQVLDGRLHLRRTQKKYDAIILDAYKSSRYGSFIPYHLVTKEFFELAREHLTDDGVVAYNVIGNLQGWRTDILGAVYATLKSVFPQVYLFPASDSWNIVMIATRNAEAFTYAKLGRQANELAARNRLSMPSFRTRMAAFRVSAPPSSNGTQVLTDDFAPLDGLLARAPSAGARHPLNRIPVPEASQIQTNREDSTKEPP
ncbi:MAG: fused MFS/spermidine synthase [Verrucomicrobia bacterium]|nr:fused MFS/spermidine synthase [Verrucomicrobiota bacterium]